MTELSAAKSAFYLEDNENPVKDFKQECVESGLSMNDTCYREIS